MDNLSFEIPYCHWVSVKKKLDSLVRRASKKGLTSFAYSVAPDMVVKKFRQQVFCNPLEDPTGQMMKWESYDVECKIVTITCPKPSLNGWTFVGRIEHLNDDGGFVNLVYAAPNIEVPVEFHHRGPICEHCQYNRRRKDTFIVVKNDEYKQVGSTCLSDFLGIDASSMLAYAEIIEGSLSICSDPDDFTEQEWGMMRQSRCYGLREITRVASALTLNKGYVSRKAAEESYRCSTADVIRSYITTRTAAEAKEIIPDSWWTDKVAQLTDDTLNWLQNLATEDMNSLGDYFRNLAAIAKANYCPWKAVGILGSAPYSLIRQQEREQQNTVDQQSQHQGKIKERINRNVKVVLARPYQSCYGTGILYKFVDNIGNRYLWFASTDQEWEVGQTMKIAGTVKSHDTDKYEGDCQVTILNRIKQVKV